MMIFMELFEIYMKVLKWDVENDKLDHFAAYILNQVRIELLKEFDDYGKRFTNDYYLARDEEGKTRIQRYFEFELYDKARLLHPFLSNQKLPSKAQMPPAKKYEDAWFDEMTAMVFEGFKQIPAAQKVLKNKKLINWSPSGFVKQWRNSTSFIHLEQMKKKTKQREI